MAYMECLGIISIIFNNHPDEVHQQQAPECSHSHQNMEHPKNSKRKLVIFWIGSDSNYILQDGLKCKSNCDSGTSLSLHRQQPMLQ